MEQLAYSVRPLPLRHGLCASSSRIWGTGRSQRKGLQNSDRIQRRFKGYIAPPGGQAYPIGGFYAELLSKPTIVQPPIAPPEATPPEPIRLRYSKTDDTWERAQQVFGDREKGAIERKKQWEAATQNIAGVMVPPRPAEPDNCCMSGCVNCVWDMYREELEEWAAKTAEARVQMQAQSREGQDGTSALAAKGASMAGSMDDDGGGSETNWTPDEGIAGLFQSIPVGIREFMRTEKNLKQRHQAEQASSAP